MTEKIKAFNLQLFAEGGAAGDGGAGAGAGAGNATTGVTGQGDAVPVYDRAARQRGVTSVRYAQPTATQAEPTPPTTTRDAAANTPPVQTDAPPARPTFEELIKGEYKDEYSKHTQEIVQRRLKESKAAEERLTKLTPALSILAQRYGIDASDPDAFVKAIDEDQSLYEDEAIREGLPVEQLMKQKRLEREVQQAKAERDQRARQEKMDATYAMLQTQSEAFKAKVPEFNLGAELRNDKFARAIMNGFSVEEAFHVTHLAEIEARRQQQTEQQMREVAQNAQQAAANAIRSNSRRPTENGLANSAPAQVRTDPSQLKLKDFRALKERAARGEAITY